jgi:tetratricopeptide (TPR) repeat protein
VQDKLAMTVPIPAWRELCCVGVPDAAASFQKLLLHIDDDAEPYKSGYAAAEEQSNLINAIKSLAEQHDHLCYDVDGTVLSYHTIMARLLIRRGKALSQTDLTADAKTSLQDGLHELSLPPRCQDLCFKHMALNELGALLSNLGQDKEALKVLNEAKELHHAVASGKADLSGSRAMLELEQDTSTDAEAFIDELYTKTVFFLAQVHQGMGHVQEATEYCGATLQRQATNLGAPCRRSCALVRVADPASR